jgi:hypothetical protein
MKNQTTITEKTNFLKKKKKKNLTKLKIETKIKRGKKK